MSAISLLFPQSTRIPKSGSARMSNIEFSTVEGYFLQDDLETDVKSFDFVGYFLNVANVHCSLKR